MIFFIVIYKNKFITVAYKNGPKLLVHPSAIASASTEFSVNEHTSGINPSSAREEDIKSRTIKNIIFIFLILFIFVKFYLFFVNFYLLNPNFPSHLY